MMRMTKFWRLNSSTLKKRSKKNSNKLMSSNMRIVRMKVITRLNQRTNRQRRKVVLTTAKMRATEEAVVATVVTTPTGEAVIEVLTEVVIEVNIAATEEGSEAVDRTTRTISLDTLRALIKPFLLIRTSLSKEVGSSEEDTEAVEAEVVSTLETTRSITIKVLKKVELSQMLRDKAQTPTKAEAATVETGEVTVEATVEITVVTTEVDIINNNNNNNS